MSSIWKDYGNYLISINGDIKSKERIVLGKNGSSRKLKSKILKKTLDRGLYHKVDIDGKTERVHFIVAKLFIPNPNNYKYIIHKDGNKLNNNYKNLQWINKEEYYELRNQQIENIHKYTKTKKTKKISPNNSTYLKKSAKIFFEILKPLVKDIYINTTYNTSLTFSIEPYIMRATGEYYQVCTIDITNTCYYLKTIKRAYNLECNTLS